MKLDCVLTACNTNPLYIDFIPSFIKCWNKLYPTVDVKIILINDIIPDKFKQHQHNIILFKPIAKISTAFIGQYIRLLYPAILNYQNGILITDMDMLPMSKNYYSENIKEYSDENFICMRDVLIKSHKQFAMCYNVAINTVWREIFNISSLEDVINRLKQIYNSIEYKIRGIGWSKDQVDLYRLALKWHEKTNKLIILEDSKTKFKRLDRAVKINTNDQIIIDNIKQGYYVDYHCYRPYKKYKTINDKIIEILCEI